MNFVKVLIPAYYVSFTGARSYHFKMNFHGTKNNYYTHLNTHTPYIKAIPKAHHKLRLAKSASHIIWI